MLLAHVTPIVILPGHAPVIAQAAVPIIPILLLPFALVFFVVIFPVWLVTLGMLGLAKLMLKAVAPAVHRTRPGALDGAIDRTARASRWVMHFGGLIGGG